MYITQPQLQLGRVMEIGIHWHRKSTGTQTALLTSEHRTLCQLLSRALRGNRLVYIDYTYIGNTSSCILDAAQKYTISSNQCSFPIRSVI